MTTHNAEEISPRAARQLQSVGMRCFVNCFERAWNNKGILTELDIISCDLGVPQGGLQPRRSGIKNIFEKKQECNVLETCLNAAFRPKEEREKMRAKARGLYNCYCNPKND